MKKVFSAPSQLEKLAKEKYAVPEFIMMEQASSFMGDFILDLCQKNNLQTPKVLIVCGKGNNGGDGYALARLLSATAEITILKTDEPTAPEAKAQALICEKLNLNITHRLNQKENPDIIVDCLFGTGFHGEVEEKYLSIIQYCNNSTGIKIACDIPSALLFKADYTLTMGEHKTVLFSDKAKAVCGEIHVGNLGLPDTAFQNCMNPDAWLIEEADMELPFRKEKSSHKGTYGHTTIFACDKAGAAIIAGTAAMNFGSGLTTLLKTSQTDLEQFKISPELMISDTIPKKTTALVIGPGIVVHRLGDNQTFIDWFTSTKNPAAVLDAGMFSFPSIASELEMLNNVPNARIVLTPHLQELSRFLEKVMEKYPDCGITEEDLKVSTLADNTEVKIHIGKILNQLYPNTAVIMKSANTFIAAENEIFICKDGCQSLAKGGSGDVLAGMTGALLAQGYSAKAAAITACEAHGLASAKIGADAFNLTPDKLINSLL